MILILIGPPGSGKSTQAEYVSEEFNIPAISLGRIMREAEAADTALGEESAKYSSKGKLAPADMAFQILKSRLEREDTDGGFILDGSPRTIDEAFMLEEYIEDKGKKIDEVFFFTLPKEESRRRLLERAKLSVEEGGGRKDDEIDDINTRLKDYYRTVDRLRSYIEKKGLGREIDADRKRYLIKEEMFRIIRTLE